MRGKTFQHRVTLQQRAGTVDSIGQRTQTWGELLTCWANVRQLQGNELLAAQSVRASVSSEVEIRFRSSLVGAAGADLRVLHQGRVLSVAAVMDRDQDGLFQQLLCSEGAHES